MSQIKCPPEFEHLLEDLRELKLDGKNPNKMTQKQLRQTWSSLRSFGWLDVILTNKEGVVADGEQRVMVCLNPEKRGLKKQGPPENFGPVLRLPVSEVDRRLIRQVKNKIKGRHDKVLDANEFHKIVAANREDDLKELLGMSDQMLIKALEQSTINGAPESQIEEETVADRVECPKCKFVFNPENFMIERVVLEEEIERVGSYIEGSPIDMSDPKGLGKTHIVELNTVYETTTPEATERVIAVSESFGVGIDETVKFKVLKDLVFEYNDDDLVYVTGDSGSGKSTILRLISQHETDRGRQVSYLDAVEVLDDELIIEALGGDADEAMRLLAAAGLSEAFLMLRRFGELSDGQKYRYRIARMLSTDVDVYIVDEIGAALDRVMAKVLVYNLQKWARRQGKMVVAASTHHDLIEDFNPDILLFKGFGETAQIRYYTPEKKEISLTKDMVIESGTLKDYEELERFHYLGRTPGYRQNIFKLTYMQKTIGVVLYISPFLGCSARNQVMPQYGGSASKERADLVNREITRLARIIIHPKFRGAGLAVKLVRETMPQTGKRVVETIAAMARYNPFFEKAGMTLVGEMIYQPHQKKLVTLIEKYGSQVAKLHSPSARETFINGLNKRKRDKLTNLLIKSLRSLRGQGGQKEGTLGRGVAEADRMVKGLVDKGLPSLLGDLLPTKRIYLYWENPEWNESMNVSKNETFGGDPP